MSKTREPTEAEARFIDWAKSEAEVKRREAAELQAAAGELDQAAAVLQSFINQDPKGA
jgi:hypothetical protein